MGCARNRVDIGRRLAPFRAGAVFLFMLAAALGDAPRAMAQSSPETTITSSPSPIDPTPSGPTTSAAATTTTLLCTLGVPPGYVEFIGIAGEPGQSVVTFVVTRSRVGEVARGSLDIALPDHAHFVTATRSYLVRAWPRDGRLVAYLTTDDCGRPRTTYADGSEVNTALLGPLSRKVPVVLLGAGATLTSIMLLVFLIGRIRVYGVERPLLVDDRDTRAAFGSRLRRRR